MRSPASPIAPPLGPHRFRDAWLGLPKVIVTYVAVTAVGLAGYIGFQYAMGAFHPAPTPESRHPDPKLPTVTPPASVEAPASSGLTARPAPIAVGPSGPVSDTMPAENPAAAIAAKLADVIASARHRNETVGQVVREEGSRLTIQILPTQSSNGSGKPKTEEFVTVGPWAAQHDQSSAPEGDGTVKHVVYVNNLTNSTTHWRPGSADAGDSISVPNKDLEKLFRALKTLADGQYKITVQVANPAVKQAVENALTR